MTIDLTEYLQDIEERINPADEEEINGGYGSILPIIGIGENLCRHHAIKALPICRGRM